MFWKLLSLILAICLIIVILCYFSKNEKECYDGHDVHQAHKALAELKKMSAEGNEPKEVSEDEIKKRSDDIQIAGLQLVKVEGYDDMKFPSYPPATLKALYNAGLPIKDVATNWPPNMLNRLYYHYPNFYTSGISWWLRPMNKYGNQSFWLKSNGNYFYIKN